MDIPRRRLREPRPRAAPQSAPTWPPEGAEPVGIDTVYAEMADRGLEYGPHFQGLRAVWRRDGEHGGTEIFAEVRLPQPLVEQAEQYILHPALFDAVLHAVVPGELLPPTGAEPEARLPFSWSGVEIQAAGASVLRARLTALGHDALTLTLWDAAGGQVATVDALTVRPVARRELRAIGARTDDPLFHVRWQPLPPQATPSPPRPGASWARTLSDCGTLEDAGPTDLVRIAVGHRRDRARHRAPASARGRCRRPVRRRTGAGARTVLLGSRHPAGVAGRRALLRRTTRRGHAGRGSHRRRRRCP
ncbi:polyketide synthase dehydratase domain-containing protein [Streptomyces albus]|nr:polyketide synthase dehydratase domain-containing protein [Streptomyces albus]